MSARSAEKWLDWGTVGPVLEQYRALIDDDIREDTKKLTSYEQFAQSDVSSRRRGTRSVWPAARSQDVSASSAASIC